MRVDRFASVCDECGTYLNEQEEIERIIEAKSDIASKSLENTRLWFLVMVIFILGAGAVAVFQTGMTIEMLYVICGAFVIIGLLNIPMLVFRKRIKDPASEARRILRERYGANPPRKAASVQMDSVLKVPTQPTALPIDQTDVIHRHERPVGVMVLAVLQMMGGIGSMGLGVLILLGSLGMAVSMDVPLFGAFGLVGGVIAASIGLLEITLGIGLFRLYNWARITTMCLCALSYISLIPSLRVVKVYPQGLIGPVLSCIVATIIIVYLSSKRVKATFGT